MSEALTRSTLLLGESSMRRLQEATVTVVGLGGVGGYVAEALARSGVGHLHLIDFDTVQPSNLNRQVFATKHTVGLLKTAAAKQRIEAVSDCTVTLFDGRVTEETVSLAVPKCDFLVDCIDSMDGKIALAVYAQTHGIPMLACMGAGNRLDPSAFAVVDLSRTEQCPLARRYRQALRRLGILHLPCVMSRERALPPQAEGIGSLAPVVGAAGLVAAGYVLQYFYELGKENER